MTKSDEKEKTPEELRLEKQKAEYEAMRAGHLSYWAVSSKIRLPSGHFTFKEHEYLFEPMHEEHPLEVDKKATQMGGSIKETLRCLHGCIYGRYPQGVGYVMPSEPEVQKFSKTKFNPIIQLNQAHIGRFVQSGGRGGTDSADLKKVGESFIHFCSASANKYIEGERTSSVATSFSCDVLVFDEVDMMDPEIVAKFISRLDHSKLKYRRYLSNPTGENYGIDALYQQSDQRLWHRLCPNCLKYTCPDQDFLEDPETLISFDYNENKGVILCRHCRKATPVYWRDKKSGAESKWVPMYKDRSMVGRHYSHLNSAYHDPFELLKMYRNPELYHLTFKEVMRNQFGFAYTPKEDQLRPNQVYEHCGQEPMRMMHSGPCVAGVDVMNKIHATVGIRTGRERYEIVRNITCDDFVELAEWFKRLNVKTAGIDIAPDMHAAKQFQKDMREYRCDVWLVDYRTSRHVGPVAYDNINRIIKADRTETMDMSHRKIIDGHLVFPRKEQIKEFVDQVCNPFKIEAKNERTGIPEYRYRGKNDHYRHALNYFLLAGKYAKIVKSETTGYMNSEYRDCVMQYSPI